MAKHLDEIPGRKIPVWQQANPYYVEDTPYPSIVQNKPKSSTKSSNSYKPSKSTKRGDTVGAGEYAVSKGDSLWKIAQAHGTTVEALRKANPEIKGNMIYPGQIIKVGNNTSANVSTATSSPSKTETKATPNKSATVRDTVVTNQVIDTTANRSLANAQANTVSRRQTNFNNSVSSDVDRSILNVAQNDLLRRNLERVPRGEDVNLRSNPREYQPTSPFMTPITEPDESITYRQTLKPVVIKGKRTLKNTKGKSKLRQKINNIQNSEKEKTKLKQAQERQNRDFTVARQFYR